MPRTARKKSRECVYHIMCRSISEFLLFRDGEDKNWYLGLVKRNCDKYHGKVYAYCLLDSHLHLHLDPQGFDISKLMHCINGAYVRYYNRKYQRHGHLFQDRFESRILDSEAYNLTVSAYIHNNPKDAEGYAGKEHLYPFSSYGIYLGLRRDTLGLVDTRFIQELFNNPEQEVFRTRYKEFVSQQRDMGFSKAKKELSSAITNEYRPGRRVILPQCPPSQVISRLAGRLMLPGKGELALKSKKQTREFRSLCAYALRVLCGLGYREICENLYNVTISGCSSLCSKGYELLRSNMQYANLFQELAGPVLV